MASAYWGPSQGVYRQQPIVSREEELSKAVEVGS